MPHNQLSSVQEGLGIHTEVRSFRFSINFFDVSFHMARNPSCLAMFYLLVWGTFVIPCRGWVDWSYPASANLTFNYIDTVYFTWTSNISDLIGGSLSIWCSTPGKLLVLHAELPSSKGANKHKRGIYSARSPEPSIYK
jgi:hypothetical protein